MTRPLVVAADIASPAANAVDARPRPADGWLAHLPVSLFASVMGIGGLSLAWRRAAATQLAPEWIGQALFWFALAVFVALVALYAAKWAVRPAAALNEARHPIKMPFLSTITIAVLVLATSGSELMLVAAQAMWWIGAIGQLALTIGIVSAWFSRPEIVPTMVTPAWFIPVVGNIVTPLAARAACSGPAASAGSTRPRSSSSSASCPRSSRASSATSRPGSRYAGPARARFPAYRDRLADCAG